jgi:pimeloyl-ACP methyl ester carboxylesterase
MQAQAKPILQSVAAVIVVSICAGTLYEQLGRQKDRKRYPQIGRSVDIGGRTLNVYCSGEGGPTVVFESGGHSSGYSWISIQPEVAKFTRTCWYDRAAYGWSDIGPLPRTYKKVAEDLHSLLKAAPIRGPHVLVGTNIGGSHIRVYNGLFPGEVAGAVLVDSSLPEATAHEPAFMKGRMASLPASIKAVNCDVVIPVLLRVGLSRLFWRRPRNLGAIHLTSAQQVEMNFLSDSPTAQAGGEGCDVETSYEAVRSAGGFGDVPLIVLTSAKPFSSPRPEDSKDVETFNELWVHKLQPQLARLSNRGRQIIVENVDSTIMFESPGAVVNAVREVVDEVRRDRIAR